MSARPSAATPPQAIYSVSAASPSTSLDWVAAIQRHAVWVVGFIAILASISSLGNGFAFDDVHIIFENDRVHSLANIPHLFAQTYWPPVEGASLYRPLTMVAFTIEWVIGQGSALPFHAANIVLYALVCVALFRLLKTLVDTNTALLASAFFAAHPVHTEAVANSVGQAELLVALFVFLASTYYIRARRDGDLSLRDISVIAGLYGAACLSKEHALVLPGLLLSSEIVVGRSESLRVRLRKIAPLFVVLGSVAVAFVFARTAVVGSLRVGGSNELLGGQGFAARVYTMLDVTMEWMRLLLWPAQLSADYSFPRTRLATGPEITMLPGLMVILGSGFLAWRSRSRKPVVTFAILWIVVTMLIPSNLIMVTGFVLAERTLFLASAAVALLLSMAVFAVWRRTSGDEIASRYALQVVVAILLALGLTRSAIRGRVWQDNETLFTHTVQDVPLSSRAHWMLAEHYATTGRQALGADEMMLAVALGPKNSVGLVRFGAEQLARGGMCRRAMPLFHRALALTPADTSLRHDAVICLNMLGHSGEAKAVASGRVIP